MWDDYIVVCVRSYDGRLLTSQSKCNIQRGVYQFNLVLKPETHKELPVYRMPDKEQNLLVEL